MQYSKETDPIIIAKQREEYIANVKKQKEEAKLQNSKINSDEINEENVDHETDFLKEKSSSSCRLTDITNIIYGGLSSRFWMLRKHINFTRILRKKDELNFPFYAWECITLVLHHREVDLVIRDEKQMAMFIKFLIYHTKTVNG